MKAPVGLLSDRTVLRQQDGGAPPRQVPRLRAQRSKESPSGAFKRQNGLASTRWRGCAPTSSRLLNEVQQCTPQWGVQATERSCDSKMEGPRPDKFPFALATNIPVGCLSDRTVLRQQDGGAALRQVRICQTAHANLCLQNDTPLCPGKTGLFAAGCAPKLPQSWSK